MAAMQFRPTPSSIIEKPPWTFTVAGSAELRITDAFIRGDNFTVFDFGEPVLTTPL